MKWADSHNSMMLTKTNETMEDFLPVSGVCEYGDVNAEIDRSQHTSFRICCTE